MIFKVIYQEDPHQVPTRESSQSLLIKAEDIIDAREKLAEHTPYNVEFIEEISDAHLEDERKHNPDFEILEF